MALTALDDVKFRLLADGVSLTREAEMAWDERNIGPITLAEYATTSGVTVELPNGEYVNAPIVESGAGAISHDGDGFVLEGCGPTLDLRIVPVPGFHTAEQLDTFAGDVRPLTSFGVTHTDRVRVSPIEGCAWKCEFCDLPFEFAYRLKHEDDLLNVIEAAAVDPQAPARHVLISGGTPRAPIPARPGRPARDDEKWIDGVFAGLAARSPLPVDVMMPPRKSLGHPAWLRGVGVNMVSINLEISDEQRAREIAKAKSKVGRAHTLDYIEAAVEAFEVGFVQSLIVFGSAIEPMESTLRGVRDLVERGCIPVLSAFRPHHRTPMAAEPAASYHEMVEVHERTLEICAELDTGVLPGPRCVACHHNTVTASDGSDFYVGPDGDLTDRGWRITS